MSSAGAYGGFTTTGVILVLFILLVIVAPGRLVRYLTPLSARAASIRIPLEAGSVFYISNSYHGESFSDLRLSNVNSNSPLR